MATTIELRRPGCEHPPDGDERRLRRPAGPRLLPHHVEPGLLRRVPADRRGPWPRASWRRPGTRQVDPSLEPELRPFPYTKAAFEARLDSIYQGLVDDVARYEAHQSWAMRTREDVVEWIFQMAPFNQTDGSWLRFIAPVGPIDEVRALLFAIYVDELGGGDPDLNHPSVYTEMMGTVGLDLPDVRSREYADTPDPARLRLHPAPLPAGGVPVPAAVLPRAAGDDPVPRVELGRAAEHGAAEPSTSASTRTSTRCTWPSTTPPPATGPWPGGRSSSTSSRSGWTRGRRSCRSSGGGCGTATSPSPPPATLADDMADRRRRPSSPADRVAAIVRDRAPKARLNHGRKQLDGKLLNDLFADPPALMKALRRRGHDRPRRSRRQPLLRPPHPRGADVQDLHDGRDRGVEGVGPLPGRRPGRDAGGRHRR